MQYQTFPGVKGGSQSLEKLKRLRLPELSGKRYLDVGCNEGFFCGFAQHEGAGRVVGIDQSKAAIQKARLRFPDIELLQQSWNHLPAGPFDVITLLSAIHYAEDQEALVHRLVALLSDDGVLVLELSLAPGGADKWVKVKRSIDERFFPTKTKLGAMLDGYAWKIVGFSVDQPGDPLRRYVVHVRKRKPYAYLLLETPGSGKTTIARNLFEKNSLPLVSGDRTYHRLANGKLPAASKALAELVAAHYTSTTIDKVAQAVFKHELVEELVDLWVNEVGFRDFALDSYVPEADRYKVRDALSERGFFPVDMTWQLKEPLPDRATTNRRAMQYRDHLVKAAGALAGHRVFQVKRRVLGEYAGKLSWHLDAPSSGENRVGSAPVKVAGWAIPRWTHHVGYEVVLRAGGEEFRTLPEKQRPDVLKAVFGDEATVPAYWAEHPCGFSLMVPFSALEQGAELYLLVDGLEIPLARLSVGRLGNKASAGIAGRVMRKLKGRC